MSNERVTSWVDDTECANILEDKELYLIRFGTHGLYVPLAYITRGDAIKALIGPVVRSQVLFMDGDPVKAPKD